MHQMAKQTDNNDEFKLISTIGSQLYFDTINKISDIINSFPPTNELFTDVLSNLGVGFFLLFMYIFSFIKVFF